MQERDNLIAAIAQGAKFQAISDRLATTVEELQAITVKLEQPLAPPPKVASEEDLNEFLARKLTDIASVLRSDPEQAKQEVQNRIDELWLEPIETEEGPAYRVTGDLRLLATMEDRKVNSFLKTLAHHSHEWTMPVPVVIPGRLPVARLATKETALAA
ncbi:hypothetical protein H7849_23785 [Alloacidobacterium dinghuense]|uniref:Uncharacterized protein n=1 Tax=Alloacidobacterium dinghuense TaxID=2763107 RepID=A0A7G8BHH7_9BACT|nr:hypothetical protein [Alloacidobacterium dinghuense]QNI31997.1 hypothetical protein H7849_23785 [Alloacidobacterium dinghuense]